jgi:ZIP family zinc transporter
MSMNTTAPWGLGLLAGITIFLGLPIARLKPVSVRTRSFLSALSTGILLFLLVEITGHLIEEVEELVENAALTQSGWPVALQYAGLFTLGFSVGLLGLVWFERRFIGLGKDEPANRYRQVKQLALLISIGLGLHNLSEGLAIAQGYGGGAIQLAWLLAIGFALHNATEGFGIAAPLAGHRVPWRFLGVCGLIAGGPTFLGAVVGSWWIGKPTEIFCLALAAGTILYIVGELLHLGRILKGEAVVEIGLLVGFFVAMGTDFALSSAFEMTASHIPRHGGYFGDAGDIYHYELVRDGRQIRLYVNDRNNRPLDTRGLTGRWVLNPDSASPITGTFQSNPDGAYLEGLLPPSIEKEPVHLKVGVLKKREWADMEFYLAH